jgi:hypothetical protein
MRGTDCWEDRALRPQTGGGGGHPNTRESCLSRSDSTACWCLPRLVGDIAHISLQISIRHILRRTLTCFRILVSGLRLCKGASWCPRSLVSLAPCRCFGLCGLRRFRSGPRPRVPRCGPELARLKLCCACAHDRSVSADLWMIVCPLRFVRAGGFESS